MPASLRIEPWQRNLGAICIAQAISATGFNFVMPFIPLFIESLGVANTNEAAQWAGAVSAATALSMAVAQPLWGGVADRFGRKPMLLRSMFGASVIIALMGLVTSPAQLLALRFIQGTITGVMAAASALVATSTPKHKLGFALGLSQVALFAGTSIGPLVGGVISDAYGYRAAFYGSGALLFVGGLIGLVFIRENFVRPPAPTVRASAWASSRELFALTLFPSLIVVVFLIQLGGVIIGPILSLFIADLSGAAGAENVATMAGVVLAASGTVSAISAVVIGRISDRIGHSRILLICLLGATVSYVPQTFVQNVWELLALRMLLGVFLGGLMPTAQALVASAVPQARRGAAFGIIGGVNAAANGIGPLAGAGIATQWGMRAVFLATGVLFAATYGWVAVRVRGAGQVREASPEPARTSTE